MNFKLYDINSKKILNTKINDSTKIKILNGEVRILTESEYGKSSKPKYTEYKKSVKEEISKDKDKLPLYDITNSKFFYTKRYNVYYMIKELSFRPLNRDLEDFLKKIDDKKSYKKLFDIMQNYDYEILERLLLKFIYYDTKDIGADVTYHKNPAYIEYLYIRPYLKRSSIINTALNISVLKIDDLPLSSERLEKTYNKIKGVLFDSSEIVSHMKHTDKNSANSIIKFYTMYGSYFLNSYLRMPNDIAYDQHLENMINTLTNTINTSPKLKTDKVIFRFIYDDYFLENVSVGDIYTENSFMSCTRKPSSSSKNQEFGQILLKIHLPKNIEGVCLSIESDSVFRREKELLMAPGSKLKLISVNSDVDFYIQDKYINRNIKKKYEFKYIGHEKYKLKEHENLEIPIIDFIRDDILGRTLDDKIKYFWKKCSETRRFYLKLPDNKLKLFYCNRYDSSSFYSKFFYYKITNGLYIFSFDDNAPNVMDCFFEMGDEVIVNYPTRFLNINDNIDVNMYGSLICNGFKVSRMRIFPRYLPIDEIGNQENIPKESLFRERIIFNKILYDLANEKRLSRFSGFKIYSESKVLDFLNSKVESQNVHYNIQKYTVKDITYKELILKILDQEAEDILYLNESLPSSMKSLHYEYNPYTYLLAKKLIFNTPDNFATYVNQAEQNIEFRVNESNLFRRVYY